MKVEDIMVNKNQFKAEKCTEKWCPLCSGKYGELKVACNTANTGYRWICKTCQQNKNRVQVYEVESSRSIRVRSLEHIKAFEGKQSHNMMYKHQMLDHKEEKVDRCAVKAGKRVSSYIQSSEFRNFELQE